MCYVGEKLIEYYYTLLFRLGIATHVIVGERPTATTPDPRSSIMILRSEAVSIPDWIRDQYRAQPAPCSIF